MKRMYSQLLLFTLISTVIYKVTCQVPSARIAANHADFVVDSVTYSGTYFGKAYSATDSADFWKNIVIPFPSAFTTSGTPINMPIIRVINQRIDESRITYPVYMRRGFTVSTIDSTSMTCNFYSDHYFFIQEISYYYLLISSTYDNNYILVFSKECAIQNDLTTPYICQASSNALMNFNSTGGTAAYVSITAQSLTYVQSQKPYNVKVQFLNVTGTSAYFKIYSRSATLGTKANSTIFYFLYYNTYYFANNQNLNFYIEQYDSINGAGNLIPSLTNCFPSQAILPLNWISWGDHQPNYLELKLMTTSAAPGCYISYNTHSNTDNRISFTFIQIISTCNNTALPLYSEIDKVCYSTCPTNTYLNAVDQTCYVTCPSRTYSYTTNYTCMDCNFDCYTCDSTGYNCLSCNSTTDFRTLYGTRCVPISGYYENNMTKAALCQRGVVVNYQCIPCNYFMQNCAVCTDQFTCTRCYIGSLVAGGCSTIVGCTSVSQSMINGVFYSVCLACDQTYYYYNYTDLKCYCKEGKQVGDYCTTVLGCVATAMVGGKVVCTYCNAGLRFQVKNNNTCVCIFGYQLKNQTCVDKCGDGYIFTSQCDDGNLDNGDGCSSECKTQVSFKCDKATKSSLCEYYGTYISITQTGVQKVDGQNQAIISFSFQPILSNLAKLDLSKYFTFKCENASFTVQKWVYHKGKAELYVNYNTNLQGKSATVDFVLQNAYIHHAPMQLNFTIKSTKGGKLLYSAPSGNDQVLSFIYIALSGVGIFLVVFCSWLHKMIGVQFLFTSQMIYYAHFGIAQYDSTVSILQYLCLSGFNYKAKSFSFINFKTHPQFQTLQFSSTLADSALVTMGVVALIPFLLMAVLHLFRKKITEKFPSLEKIAQQKLILTEFVCPLLLSYTFPLFFIASTNIIRANGNQTSFLSSELRGIFLFSLTALYCLNFHSFTQRMLIFPQLQDNKINFFMEQAKNCYMFVFQLLMIISFALCCLWAKMNFNYSLLSLIGVFGLMFLWQLMVRPYSNVIDNIGISLNIFVVLGFLILVFLRNTHILQPGQSNSNIIRYASLISIILCFLISAIRLFLAIRRKLQKSHLQKIIQTEGEHKQQVQANNQHQKEEKQSTQKKSVRNIKHSVLIESYDRVMPILNYKAFKEGEKSKLLSKEYLDMVKSYRRKFRKKNLNQKLNQEN